MFRSVSTEIPNIQRQLCWVEKRGQEGQGYWQVIEYECHFNSNTRDNARLFQSRSLPLFIDKSQLEQRFIIDGHYQAELEILWCHLAYFNDPFLQAFFLDVLLNDALIEKFCRSQGSLKHHHAYAGGLIEHSLEVAQNAALLCHQHQLGQRAQEVAFLGGLFHDIGKTILFYNDTDGVCGEHEAYNFLVLSRPLERLKSASPALFEALSGSLYLQNEHHKDPYKIAKIVRMCDSLSAQCFDWKEAFSHVPSYFWYTKSRDQSCIFKRLKK